MKQQKYKYYMQHEDTGRITSRVFDLEEIESYDGVQIPHRYFIFQRCQFIGLLDKSGVEIYEGDIVNAKTLYDKLKLYEISYIDDFAMYGFKNPSEKYQTTREINRFEIEAIGNIYENPELLT